MPELPEVEALRRQLGTIVDGQIIAAVHILQSHARMGITAATFNGLQGTAVQGVGRKGKFLILSFSDQTDLVIHLGMSGRIVQRGPNTKHDLFAFELSNTKSIVYNDFRRFGRIYRVSHEETGFSGPLSALGPEPLSRHFTAAAIPPQSRRSIKDTLLDQHIVAGIGNIYACESLYHAQIDPRRATRSLSLTERTRLVGAIKRTLRRAIHHGGSTLDDYRGTEGEAGNFDRSFAVFAKAGQRCPQCTCDAHIEQITQQGRSTFLCPTLQR